MLCLNNFIIVGVPNRSRDLVDKISDATGLEVRELFFNNHKILVGIQNGKCLISNENSLLLLHGIFLGETPSSLFGKLINNFKAFSKEYKHQGVLALIDSKERIIKILGDPVGTRSIFFFIIPEMFIVSTDMKFLRSVAHALGIQLEQDVLALYEIIAFGYIVSRRTIFKNVNRLLPGEILSVDASKGVFGHLVSRYWNMEPVSTHYEYRKIIAKLLKYLIDQLNNYCKETIGTEIAVPISGGIDSSLLLLLASKTEKCSQIRAVHVNFENHRELLLSKYISIKAKTPLDAHIIPLLQLRENYIQELIDMLRIVGYPREGDASLPYLVLARFLKEKEFVFSIGGDDADSVYGGYDYYKFFAMQLILQKRILELLKLMKILRKYNYSGEKQYFISLHILLQFILGFYPIRYQHFKLHLHRLSSIKNKRVISLIAQYLAELSSILYSASAHNYYHEMLRKMLIHKASHLVHTRVKAEESQGIVTFLPNALREVIELIMQIPPEYFFFPIGSRSLPRLILKYLGAPQAIYLQSKSGFDITTYVLRDPEILSYMENYINNCWVSRYVKKADADSLQKHNLFNICIITKHCKNFDKDVCEHY